jgi:hypothetical protein
LVVANAVRGITATEPTAAAAFNNSRRVAISPVGGCEFSVTFFLSQYKSRSILTALLTRRRSVLLMPSGRPAFSLEGDYESTQPFSMVAAQFGYRASDKPRITQGFGAAT